MKDRPRPRQWSRLHQAETLIQTRADLERSCETLWQLYYEKAIAMVPEQRDEWLRRMEHVETFKHAATKDLEAFVEELCRRADGPPCS